MGVDRTYRRPEISQNWTGFSRIPPAAAKGTRPALRRGWGALGVGLPRGGSPRRRNPTRSGDCCDAAVVGVAMGGTLIISRGPGEELVERVGPLQTMIAKNFKVAVG